MELGCAEYHWSNWLVKYIIMLYTFALAALMAGGVWFIKEIHKLIGNIGQGGPFLFMALMFAWDGVFIFMMLQYAERIEVAIGIAIGTLFKVLGLLKTFKLN